MTADDTTMQAAAAARRLGFNIAAFTELRTASHIVLAAAEQCIVARVSKTAGAAVTAAVEDVLRVALLVGLAGAPVVGPVTSRVGHLRDGRPVTFWPMARSAGRVTPRDMSGLAAHLHACEPPDELPVWDPAQRTARKHQQLEAIATIESLPSSYAATLAERWGCCEETLQGVQPPEPWVIVHGDMHPANVVRWPVGLALCDLDGLCHGPREVDLAKMVFHCDRFRDPGDSDRFLAAYKQPYDAETVAALRGVLEISACVWLASLWDTRPDTRDELRHRIGSLDDPTVRWAAV